MFPLNPTPIGGLSLIAHIVINIVAFVYRNIYKVLSKFYPNLNLKKTDSFSSKNNYFFVRKVFAFVIILFVFISVSSASFTILRLFLTINDKVDSNSQVTVVSVMKDNINNQNPQIVYDYNVKQTIKNNDTISGYSSKIINSDKNNLESKSLIDKLRSLGVNNPDSNFRALLALNLDIISDVSLYEGSEKQNLNILRRIDENEVFAKDLINKLLANEK